MILDSNGKAFKVDGAYVEVRDFRQAIDVWLHAPVPYDWGGRAPLLQTSMTLYEQENDHPLPPGLLPTMRLDPDAAQALFEGLWAVGLRPKAPKPSEVAGELAAAQRHLADLRALYFNSVSVPLP